MTTSISKVGVSLVSNARDEIGYALLLGSVFVYNCFGNKLVGFYAGQTIPIWVIRAEMLLLVKCYENKKVKSPYCWVIYPLAQPIGG